MTSNFKPQPEKLYSVNTVSNYEIFTDNLYSVLQDIDQLVNVQYKEPVYTLYYTSYDQLDDNSGTQAKNNKELKEMCDVILKALTTDYPMPIISIDSTNNEFLSCDNNNLIFFFNAIKEKDKRDLLYKRIYSQFTPGEWLTSLKYINKNLESTKDEIIEYFFEKTYQKETPKEQLRFLKSLLSVPEMKIVSKHRDDILQILENCYEEFLNFDKEQDSQPKSYLYTSDSPRSFVDHFLSSQESSDNWYLYQKFTSSGKFINESTHGLDLFEKPDFILEPININHKVLMSQYSTLINETNVKTMLSDIVKSISYGGGIEGISKVDQIYCQEDYKSTLYVKINNKYTKDNVMDNFKKILPNIFEFYQASVFPKSKIADHEKEKLLKQALSTFILDAKIPNKESLGMDSIKKRKI